jgi:hypothetical protein
METVVSSIRNANSEGSIMKFLPGICATVLAATFAFPISSPVNAAPVFVPKAQAVQSQIIQIKDGDAKWRRSYGWHDDYDNFWVPAGAFLAGALIGGAIANNNAYPRGYYDYDRPYYGRRYYARRYYGDRYYGPRYYRSRYYGDRYYGDRYYGRSYAIGRPCSPGLDDAGKCRSNGLGYYGGYGRRVVVMER